MSRLLLIAPDSDLRRSLEFALRAEGHDVSWRASLGARDLSSRFDCTVLDHHAIGTNMQEGTAFCRVFAPVILLANTGDHPLAPAAFMTVLKPLLGPALIEAIDRAVTVGATTK
jgi:DNA-binding NtrC family response regulator